MSVPDTETHYAQMVIHLSTVVWDVCSRHRNSLCSDGITPVNSCRGGLYQTTQLSVPDTETPFDISISYFFKNRTDLHCGVTLKIYILSFHENCLVGNPGEGLL